MKTTAREYLLKRVIAFTKENWDRLNKLNHSVDENILKDLKKEEYILDWMLGEVLSYHPNECFIVVLRNLDKENDTHTVIYQLGKKFIRGQIQHADLNKKPVMYEFVKPKKKRITVIDYFPVETKRIVNDTAE
jgi:hypothetical protein